jgi:outer membrane protein TolC
MSPLRSALPVCLTHRLALGAVASAATLALATGDAYALQPLTDFLGHARTFNPDNRAARATAEQRDAEVGVTTGNLEPNLALNAFYTRNQFEVTTGSLLGGASTPAGFPTLVIQPHDQLDANIILTIPILNIANWDRRSVAQATHEAAKADVENATLAVAKTVTRTYYLLTGYEAVLQSAIKNLEVAQHNVKLARDKKESGTGSELDVQRALADTARTEQSVTSAQLNVVNTRRDLLSLTGVPPEAARVFPEDDLHAEGPLEGWMSGSDTLPSVKSAIATRESAERASHAARTGWVPTVSGVGEEKFTNATAFAGGHSAYFLLQLTANWKLDNTILPQIRAQNAIAAEARANEDKVRQAASDNVYRDWQQIGADIEASRSARAQVQATKLAASLAEDRYASGVATQLDVLQARQDAFAADVARIQADADLAYARAALRIDSSRPLSEGSPR